MDRRARLRMYCAWASTSGYGNNLNGQIRRTGRSPSRGSTAIVFHGTIIPNGPEVAIKTFHNALLGSDVELKRVFREVHTWSKLRHENIVPMFGISTDFDSTISIISAWMPMGNAYTYVQNVENDPRPLIRDIANGLHYLHSHELGPVVHGDLKGLNVLVSGDRRGLLSDFGLATLNVSSFNMTTDAIRGGSYHWMAPELLDDFPASTASDAWAFGMTTLELFTRAVPFPGCRNLANVVGRIVRGDLPLRPAAESTHFRLTDAWWDICTLCWRTYPSSRPTTEAIVEMVRRAAYETGPAASRASHPIVVDTVALFSTGVAFSPDGRRIMSGSANRLMCQWDVHSCTEISSAFSGHQDWVRSVAFSPNGEWVASGSYDSTIRLWDAYRGMQSGFPLRGHTGRVFSVVFSPTGREVLSGSGDTTIGLWDIQTRTKVDTLRGHTDKVQSVAVSREGVIASGSFDGTLRLWDTRTRGICSFNGHTGMIWSVAFSPDGRKVVSSSQDSSLCVWDVRNGSQVDHHLEGHTDEVTSVAFSPCGTRLVSGSMDADVILWDARYGVRVGAPLRGNAGWVRCVTFSPGDGGQIVSGTDDGSICLWNARIH
ncbi:WD40 repeat-like protein [Pisolithus marmoratus]|nr:WD40 repeat-like protein [Pisolithus marmoratus]